MDAEMRYIYTIYRAGSFSAAAKELYLTQPALSIAVAKAEEKIGMPLFDRTKRPLSLTAAGEVYIQKYREIQSLEQELSRQLGDIAGCKTGELRIGGSHYLIAHILPPVLTAFSEKYPDIRLQITEADAVSLLRMLETDDIDLTFSCEETEHDAFRRSPCFRDHLLLAVPTSKVLPAALSYAALSPEQIRRGRHLEADCPEVSLTDFRDLPFLLMTPGNDLHRRSTAMFREAGISPEIRLMTGQLATIWHLTEAGMGASFIADRLVPPYEAKVSFFRIRSAHTTRLFYLMTSERRYLSHAARAFGELLPTI